MITVDEWSKVRGWESNDDPETISFKTYKNYLESLSMMITHTYGIDEEMFRELKTKFNSMSMNVNVKININFEKIKTLLINCWHTELNFLLPTKITGDFSRYSLHWAPVQVYYSLYLAIRALCESSGHLVKNTHEPTLKFISDWIVNRNLFPYPWSCNCKGISDLGNCNFLSFKGTVNESNVRELVALSLPQSDNCELFLAKFLRTTREIQFNQKKFRVGNIKTKTGKTPKRFTRSQKRLIDEKYLYETTLFDCLYRLRIKSNYENAETYILSEMSNGDADNFYNSFRVVLSSSLFILELLIKKFLGNKLFKDILEEFEGAKRTTFFDGESIFFRKQFF